MEAGREHVGKKGVVRSPHVHEQVLERVMAGAREMGLEPIGLDHSPIKGPEGNIEYLLHLRKSDGCEQVGGVDASIARVVSSAHVSLA